MEDSVTTQPSPHAARIEPPRATMLEFMTVTTGHTATTPRSAVAEDVIAQLRPIALAGRGHIRGWDIQMVKGETGGGAGFTLKRDGHFLTCSYVAWTAEGVAEFWPVAQQVAAKGFGTAVEQPPSQLPWLAAVVMPCEPTAIPLLSEAADLERCLAWTVLELASEPDEEEMPIEDESPKTTARPSADGARLVIGPGGLTMTVQLADPSAAEVADIRRGKMDIGILTVGGTGIVLTRFGAAADTPRFPAQAPLVFESPFHVGLLPPDRRHLPKRDEGMSLGLTIVVQDQYGQQHGGRLVGLSIPTVEAIERVVVRQAEDAARSGWTRKTHDAEVGRFCERNPDIGRAADRLFSKAWASETIQ